MVEKDIDNKHLNNTAGGTPAIDSVFSGSGDDISLGLLVNTTSEKTESPESSQIEGDTSVQGSESQGSLSAGSAASESKTPETQIVAASTPPAPVELTPAERFLATRVLTFLAPDVPPVELRSRRRRGDEHRSGSDSEREESTVRRRTRRRADEDASPSADDPQNTVIKVRKPREKVALITEPQKVKGSTRLEAKKQRRRDGREVGRRRSVITESEFLARRESVDRVMVVRSKNNRTQIGVLEDGVLAEHYVARSQEGSLIGNVYLGRVQNVLPSMEAAFVDIGRGRNAVLYSGEVDWDGIETGSQPRKIENALKAGDQVLVQVTKDPIGHKGARLTSQISLPGRYLVYVPNGSMNGISRKLPDTERARLKKILKEVLPDNAGVIVRTAAEGASEEQLTLDVTRLTEQWAAISSAQAGKSQAPQLLHSEPDMLIKIVRDVFNEDFTKMVISGEDAQKTITSYLKQVAPDLVDRVEAYEGDRDLFNEYRISEQISKALDRKVWLPSGGSLIIDRTEAMTVIDVNTGKFVGSGGNLEETVTKNNLEAAEEIVRQLRLRDIGGIIVIDFIDMVLESNRELVLRRLVECLSRDRTKHQVAEVTSLGLVQMTRKKLGLGLLESYSESCEACAGRGVVVHGEPIEKHRSSQNESRRRNGKGSSSHSAPAVQAPSAQAHAITDDAKNALAQIAASTISGAKDDDSTDPDYDETEESFVAEKLELPRGRKRNLNVDVSDISTTEALESSLGLDLSLIRAQRPEPSQAAQKSSAPPARKPRRASASAGSGGLNLPIITGSSTEDEEHGSQEPIEVPVLGIPIVSKTERPARVSVSDAEQILGSVLDALPEPPAPGRSRSRSRRVTTSPIKGGADSEQRSADSESDEQ
ncbi:Rne/Rng family ribonuclease [Lysinibacter sp. HNR]|uniref:Rne/Rng family ribonuclease n=1 Tax=Lysinibacter sp. HNR TaxID=3031408 RepID=UPI002435A565|nr:Rne/Rng family ribonuclease [Lysinibacter sp. HNR]WGD36272.1 Rne/Rng family ribonuclease [Lysinibacter sp. HNR]